MTEKIVYLTVSALNNYIEKKYKFDPYLKEIYIKGEVSNCKLHSNGNFYFTIKDNYTKIEATKFNGKEYSDIKEGDTVYLKASLNFFLSLGQQRLNVQEIKKDTIGELYQQLQELKEKLNKEGLFESKYKKSLPKFPKNIAVITSETGAAIQDIKRTILRRYPIAKIIVYSSLVQGEDSVNDIIKNIKLADNNINDVIILARGGGSIEDLWSFNSEAVARAIFSCNTPIVTGVGHETDTTLVDYVSDLRASTPTAAAEIVTPYSLNELKEYLNNINYKLDTFLKFNINKKKKDLLYLKNNYHIKNYELVYYDYRKKLIKNREQLDLLIKNKLNINKNNILNNKKRFKDVEFMSYFVNKFRFNIELLEINSPINILKRGYSIAYKDNKKINSIKDIKINDKINIKFLDGIIEANVVNIKKEE